MRLSYILATCFFIFNCNPKTSIDVINIGEKLPKNAKVTKDTILIMYEPNSLKIGRNIVYNKINYLVYLNESESIKAIYTYDPDFMTTENYKIGMQYSKIKLKHKEIIFPGYGCHIELSSGWGAVINDEGIIKNKTVSDTSTIKYFYKTDFGTWISKYGQ